MTNYEFLEQVIQYVKRTYNTDLYASELGKQTIMLQTRYEGNGNCGGSINLNSDFESFKERLYSLCNFILKNKRK